MAPRGIRCVVDAIRYITNNGAKWRALPAGFGIPWRTVFGYFARWAKAGVLRHVLDHLRQRLRIRRQRVLGQSERSDPSPPITRHRHGDWNYTLHPQHPIDAATTDSTSAQAPASSPPRIARHSLQDPELTGMTR
ncbi:transposase [Streptomyces sp. NPDC048251]|uniref:transposase n=1 Tax=Streptomyces sp. NPDC048251 TaxID=3154501 RepID=UPI00343C3C88